MRHGRKERGVRPERRIPFVRAAKQWEAAIEGANLSENTRKSYMVSIRQYHHWLVESGIAHPALSDLSPLRVRDYLGYLRRQRLRGQARYQSSSLHTKCVALKIFSTWCAGEHLMRGDRPLARVKNPKVAKKVSHPYTIEEAQALMAAARRSSQAPRDVALLLLAFATGARAGELSALRVDRLDLEGLHITVTGKGAKERVLAFDEATADAMGLWMAARASGAPEVFVSATGQPMSGQTLYGVFSRLGRAAGVRGARPHRSRDTFAVYYLASHENDIVGLQERLGHENIGMTVRYAKAARALSPLLGLGVVQQLGLT